jgi:phosphatidylserine decarboxylase
VVKHANGKEVLFRQIAGAVARRIVYYVKPGQRVERNEQFGFIKFGSRVDIFLPLGSEVVAQMGQVTKGNETVIARW